MIVTSIMAAIVTYHIKHQVRENYFVVFASNPLSSRQMKRPLCRLDNVCLICLANSSCGLGNMKSTVFLLSSSAGFGELVACIVLVATNRSVTTLFPSP